MAEDEGSGKISIVVLLILILVVGGVSAGISYFYSQQVSQTRIGTLQRTINDLEERLASTPAPPGPTQTPAPVVSKELDCPLCHDMAQHKEFHVPEIIMKIDEAHGLRRRTCIDCHGPNGPPWSSDEQMTDFADISFDPTAGVNGKFVLSNKVVHSIHKRKLDAGILSCEFCHVAPGTEDFIKPEVKTELGRVLYCQNEGCHDSEGGNYIAIHLELRPFKCTTCHTGDLVAVHLGGTGKLGQFVTINATTSHVLH